MSNPSLRSRAARRGGFTLLEILVAVGIIIVLTSILIPVVAKARRAAGVVRAQRDLETIATALEAYKGIYQMYPQVTELPGGPSAPHYDSNLADDINNVDGIAIFNDNGARALYSALMLRGNVRLTRTSDSANAIHVGGSATYGPLLDVGKIKVGPDPTLTSINFIAGGTPNLFICDANGNPILYVPASPVPLNYTRTSLAVQPPAQYLDDSLKSVLDKNHIYYDFHAIPALVPDSGNPGQTIKPFHNSSPSFINFGSPGLYEMQSLMGCDSHGGNIDTTRNPPDKAAYTGPYILWSAGADGQFGINLSSGKSDDVANFDLFAKYVGR